LCFQFIKQATLVVVQRHRVLKAPVKLHRISDIYQKYMDDYKKSPDRGLFLEPKHDLAINCSCACRTEKMGGVVLACPDCGDMHYHYHSCGHRFCPTCGVYATNKWAKKILRNLLNLRHYHIVLTLPYKLRRLAQRNGDLLHDLLFTIAAKVIQEWFAARGLLCGIIAVLHTAGSDLKYHPHVHLIVSAGGADLETGAIEELTGNYLMYHKYLAKKFRYYFTQALIKLYDKEALKVQGEYLHRPFFMNFIKKLNEKAWIVGIDKPLKDATDIVRYVARYTRRACMSEYKIISIDDGKISFSFNDYKNTPRGQYPPTQGVCTLPYVEFLDRLLQHVPNPGFQAVRRYGLYTGRNMKKIPPQYKLPEVVIVEGEQAEIDNNSDELGDDPAEWETTYDRCPHCGTKRVIIEVFMAKRLLNRPNNVINRPTEYENSA
jgi:Putative transposase/Transposase zinc-binding domain